MASLSQGNVKSVKFVDIPSLNLVVGIWHLVLASSSDTLVVPGLASTDGVENLEATISVSAAAMDEGQSTLTISGGSSGTETLIVTRHRTGLLNNLSLDEDPT